MNVFSTAAAAPGRYLITSLGCKVNQAEAAWLGQSLGQCGWRQAASGQEADLVILLTCSVTSQAARQSRQMARRLARAHPRARVVVTGCDVQAAADTYQGQGYDLAGRARLADLPELLSSGQTLEGMAIGSPDAGPFCPGYSLPSAQRARSQLKVQDGCDAFCAYCVVPHARGRPRSLPLDQAQQQFARLAQAGSAEVVITGIHLGLYGRDLDPPSDVKGLLEALLALGPGPRLRLSSLEVNEVGEDLLELMAGEDRLCPHLHIPLQSGSDQVLAAMNRPYNAAQYAETVQRALGQVEGLCVGADVLVGLPGEDQAAFDQTRQLIESLDLAYLHVFPYSPRPGTPAANMKHPPSKVAKERATILRQAAERKHRHFLGAQTGRRMEVVVEQSGLGRSGNYCLVQLEHPTPPGARLWVEISGVHPSPGPPRLAARILSKL